MEAQHAMTTDAYAEWRDALARARLAVTVAELHGSVVGYVCAGWSGNAHELLAALELEVGAGGASDALQALVARAAAAAVARLRAGQPVEPLLPAEPLAARADALVDWCRGLLGGLGLTGALDELDDAPDVHETLANLGHVAAMHLKCHAGDEAMLEDVLDFVRQGVAQLGAALTPPGRA